MWDMAAFVVLSTLLISHWRIHMVYSSRISQLDADMAEMYPDIEEDARLKRAVIDRVRMSAQAKVDRTSNFHAITINAICAGGLAIMIALSYVEATKSVEWMALLLLPIPGFLLVYHLRNIYAWPVGRRWLRQNGSYTAVRKFVMVGAHMLGRRCITDFVILV